MATIFTGGWHRSMSETDDALGDQVLLRLGQVRAVASAPANDYTALFSGYYWSGFEASDAPTIITYSFPTTGAPPGYIASPTDPALTPAAIASFQGFSDAEQKLAVKALNEWGDASGVIFIKVAPGQGDINFEKMDLSGTSYGAAGGIGYFPFGDWNYDTRPQFRSDLDWAGDVIMNSAVTIAYPTLLHEIGHALGLKHPDEPWTDYVPDTPVVHSVWQNGDPDASIMTETGHAQHLTPIDIQAIQSIYGTNAEDGSEVASWHWNAAKQTLVQTGYAGDDAIRGSSVIDQIDGGDGNDRLFGLNGDDQLTGGTGNDLLEGGPGADKLTGGLGDDRYYVDNPGDKVIEQPGAGNDYVVATVDFTLPANVESLQFWGSAALTGRGNTLGNTIYGNDGGDHLFGLDGADYIVGGALGDVIQGGTGDDQLYGGGGGDQLTGGAGRDYMAGGTGADRFTFANGDFGGATTATADEITDFSHADHDRLDLRQVDAIPATGAHDAFAFIGGAAFDGHAGELRFEAPGDGNGYVYGDLNGDGIADFAIRLDGVTTLAASDLLLS